MTAAPLISVPELAAMLGRPSRPALLDVRWSLSGPPGIELFRAGHIPGAVFCDLDRDLAGPPGVGGRHPLPRPEEFQAAMRVHGVSNDKPVVVYDAADASAAARAWWCLRYFGHGDVRVLDGGYRAWRAATLPIATDEPTVAPGDFAARPGGMPLLGAAEAAAVARDGVLLDARAHERYRGDAEPIDPVAGHIPGAISAPATGVVDDAGLFRSPEELRKWFAELGVSAARPVGAYCGSGVTAAHEVLALELAGIRAGLYVGSWSHWITDPSRPVAIGGSPS